MEKQHVTETLEMCMNQSANLRRLQTTWKNHSLLSRSIGARCPLAICYRNLGAKFCVFRNYRKANEYNKKALAIVTDIGDRQGLAQVYMIQGAVEEGVGALMKAEEYFKKALAISKENWKQDTRSNRLPLPWTFLFHTGSICWSGRIYQHGTYIK